MNVHKIKVLFFCFNFLFSFQVLYGGERESGGDFGYGENVLKFSKNLITIYLSRLSSDDWEEIKEDLPTPKYVNYKKTYMPLNNVSLEFLVDIIFNVRQKFDKSSVKVMDWGRDADGIIYIEALESFSLQFGQYWDEIRTDAGSPYIREAMERILKEASHVWGFSDDQGRLFGKTIVSHLVHGFSIKKSTSGNLMSATYIPEYGIKVIRLPSKRYQIRECEISKTEIICDKIMGLRAGYTPEILESKSQYYSIQANRVVKGSIQMSLSLLSAYLSLVVPVGTGTIGGAAVGGTFCGGPCGLLGGIGGFFLGLEFTKMGFIYIVQKLGSWGYINYTENQDIAEFNPENEIYFFFRSQNSIDDIKFQLLSL